MNLYYYSKIFSQISKRKQWFKSYINVSNVDENNLENSKEKKESYFESFKFPIATWIIIFHELLERYAFYGFRVLLTIYFNLGLNISKETTTIIYHLFTAVSYLTPIVGAVIADNFIGRYMTVVIIGLIYMAGFIGIAIISIHRNVVLSIIFIFILAIGAGGIKSSISAFGADQMDPTRLRMIDLYFSVFYIVINVGSTISYLTGPIMRRDYYCFDYDCYFLAFGVPAMVFIITYLIFVCCKPFYTHVNPSRNVIVDFFKCCFLGIKQRYTNKNEKYPQTLDYAIVGYPQEFIEDCKKVVKLLIVFVPIPIFWCLWDQQGSRFTIQATNMNGQLGDYTVKPEQLQILNPIMVVILIPVFDLLIYPLLSKINILQTNTSRIITAYLFVAISFFIASAIEFGINANVLYKMKNNNGQLIFVNLNESCPIDININSQHISLNAIERMTLKPAVYNVMFNLECIKQNFTSQLLVEKDLIKTTIIYSKKVVQIDVDKPIMIGLSYIRRLDPFELGRNLNFTIKRLEKVDDLTSEYLTIQAGKFHILLKGNIVETFVIQPNSFISITIDSNSTYKVVNEFMPQSLHMLWQIPLYIFLSISEIFLSVTAMTIAYSGAPTSMKSMMQAVQLITLFLGNIIVVATAPLDKSIAYEYEFILFGILGILAGIINFILIWKFAKDI